MWIAGTTHHRLPEVVDFSTNGKVIEADFVDSGSGRPKTRIRLRRKLRYVADRQATVGAVISPSSIKQASSYMIFHGSRGAAGGAVCACDIRSLLFAIHF